MLDELVADTQAKSSEGSIGLKEKLEHIEAVIAMIESQQNALSNDLDMYKASSKELMRSWAVAGADQGKKMNLMGMAIQHVRNQLEGDRAKSREREDSFMGKAEMAEGSLLKGQKRMVEDLESRLNDHSKRLKACELDLEDKAKELKLFEKGFRKMDRWMTKTVADIEDLKASRGDSFTSNNDGRSASRRASGTPASADNGTPQPSDFSVTDQKERVDCVQRENDFRRSAANEKPDVNRSEQLPHLQPRRLPPSAPVVNNDTHLPSPPAVGTTNVSSMRFTLDDAYRMANR